ncbi:MAG: 4Fe-4S binding protein [Candidatus Bathyarchaeia archaeon]
MLELPNVTVDLDKCQGCGTCVDVCPMNVYDLIEMPEYGGEKKAKPTRMEDCIVCLSCVNSCPNQAITVEE